MTTPTRFAASSRLLHWVMAAAILSMLLIGGSMVTSVRHYATLVSIHKPLGILVLVLVVIRFVNRQLRPLPRALPTMSPLEQFVALWSERLFYVLMFALPVVGWAMLSAERYPIVLFGPVHLPPIAPVSTRLYTVLRTTHSVLAYALFFAFMSHLSAVLFHTIVLRDGLLRRMAPFGRRPAEGSS